MHARATPWLHFARLFLFGCRAAGRTQSWSVQIEEPIQGHIGPAVAALSAGRRLGFVDVTYAFMYVDRVAIDAAFTFIDFSDDSGSAAFLLLDEAFLVFVGLLVTAFAWISTRTKSATKTVKKKKSCLRIA